MVSAYRLSEFASSSLGVESACILNSSPGAFIAVKFNSSWPFIAPIAPISYSSNWIFRLKFFQLRHAGSLCRFCLYSLSGSWCPVQKRLPIHRAEGKHWPLGHAPPAPGHLGRVVLSGLFMQAPTDAVHIFSRPCAPLYDAVGCEDGPSTALRLRLGQRIPTKVTNVILLLCYYYLFIGYWTHLKKQYWNFAPGDLRWPTAETNKELWLNIWLIGSSEHGNCGLCSILFIAIHKVKGHSTGKPLYWQ